MQPFCFFSFQLWRFNKEETVSMETAFLLILIRQEPVFLGIAKHLLRKGLRIF